MKIRIKIVALLLCMAMVATLSVSAADKRFDLSGDNCFVVSEMNAEDITSAFKQSGKEKVYYHN